MTASENGIGRTTFLDYRPSTQWDNSGGDGISDLPFVVWTVTEIVHDDGLCAGTACTNAGSAHSIGTSYRYEAGRYDHVNRAFRGFAVTQTEELADPATPHRGAVTIYSQAAATAGKVLSTAIYDATGTVDQKPISASFNTWECANPTTGALIACPSIPNGNVWVRLKRVRDASYSNFSVAGAKETVTENVSWDDCGSAPAQYFGNVREVTRGAASGPLLRTTTDYACNTTGAYIVDRPTHVLVSNTSGTTPLEEKWFFYDNQGYGVVTTGNVTKTETWVSQSTADPHAACTRTPSQAGAGCVSTQTGYDGYGNIVSVTDALLRVTTTEYDAATKIHPVHVTQPDVAGASGYQVKREHDPGCGTLLSENIPYPSGGAPSGSKMIHQYDAFCRRVKTWRPGESTGGIPYRQYTYHLGAPAESGTAAHLTVTSIQAREPNNGGTRLTTILADGLGRVIQQKSESFVEGAAASVATATRYDSQGRVSQQSVPFVWTDPNPDGSFLRFSEPGGAAMAGFEYDAVGRATKSTQPDGKFVTAEHNIAWQTTTRDECAQANETCPGSKTIEQRDALGRTVERAVYDEANSLKARTRFDYDELGRLIATVQGDAAGWNYATLAYSAYDSLGRVLARRAPDASAVDWRYGYDPAGNLRYQDDPKSGQHLEFCYDELGRVTKKFVLAGDTFTNKSCADAGTVTYTYNNTAVLGLGQLLGVADEAGSWTALEFDRLGRVLREQRSITIGGDTTAAEMKYQYDATGDHLWKLTYPDGEVVTYSYDVAGRVTSMSGAETYLINLTYDVFGRPRKITHANTVEDERHYAHPGHRLSAITSTRGAVPPTTQLLNYYYASYDAAGRLREINDLTPDKGPAGELDNGAVYTYDALGRLTQATGPKIGTLNYEPHTNVLGNLDRKDGKPIAYSSSSRPHQPTHYDGQTVAHDSNGSRTAIFATAHVFDYDKENRLIDIDNGQVTFVYDHAGRRAIMQRADGIDVRYFNPLFEASSLGTVTKYYVAGGMLIAQRDETNATFAAAANGAAVRVAARSLLEPTAVVLILRRDVQIGLAAAILAGSAALIAIPPRRRRRRVAGIRVRRRHALVTAALLGVTTMPWPIVLFPAAAGGQCGATPIATHYHLDHLGSTQLLTNPAGGVIHHVRYMPYGEPRRFTAAFAPKNADPRFRREFTGYETEIHSKLQYAGARFYDPVLGMFQTHDPARQFASPYTYGNWDPVNGTDPTGAIFGLGEILSGIIIGAMVGASVGATAAAIQAAVNGASVGNIFKAFTIGFALGAATGAASGVLQPALSAALSFAIGGIGSAAADTTASILISAGGLAQSAYGLSQGDYVNGAIGIAAFAVGVLRLATQGADGALSQQEQLDLSADQFGQRFSTPFQRGVWSSVRYIGKILATDLYAAAVGQVGEVWSFGENLWGVGKNLLNGDLVGAGKGLLATAFDLLVPNYGYYGGAGWGTRQFGDLGIPVPLNRVDWASFHHDINFRHFQWVRSVWSPGSFGLPPGPLGLVYGAIGSPPFALAGAFQ